MLKHFSNPSIDHPNNYICMCIYANLKCSHTAIDTYIQAWIHALSGSEHAYILYTYTRIQTYIHTRIQTNTHDACIQGWKCSADQQGLLCTVTRKANTHIHRRTHIVHTYTQINRNCCAVWQQRQKHAHTHTYHAYIYTRRDGSTQPINGDEWTTLHNGDIGHFVPCKQVNLHATCVCRCIYQVTCTCIWFQGCDVNSCVCLSVCIECVCMCVCLWMYMYVCACVCDVCATRAILIPSQIYTLICTSSCRALHNESHTRMYVCMYVHVQYIFWLDK